MKNWELYKDKLKELSKSLEATLSGLDVEFELKTPDSEDFEKSFKVPYLLLKYYIDEDHFRERKIELFEYYLTNPLEETVSLIRDMVEEFLMEIDQSEYGGG
ncbi:MAG: dephospho-CoA kinase [Acidobacteria bacterium]|jgi:dephospho-CoA kinase|nr:MAG: dephospho-CoA kinase [Acidobacteriota bacterium]